MQVGASNELPETAELDALYDRFLLRRRVSSVTTGSTTDMLQGAMQRARSKQSSFATTELPDDSAVLNKDRVNETAGLANGSGSLTTSSSSSSSEPAGDNDTTFSYSELSSIR